MNVLGFNGNAIKAAPYRAYYFIDNVVVEKASSTSVTDVDKYHYVNLYPNPFSKHATLVFNNPFGQNYRLLIFNTQGQIQEELKGNTNMFRIERNDLPSGFYYYRLCNEKGVIANGKFIIQ